jgi:hypothetical protein
MVFVDDLTMGKEDEKWTGKRWFPIWWKGSGNGSLYVVGMVIEGTFEIRWICAVRGFFNQVKGSEEVVMIVVAEGKVGI